MIPIPPSLSDPAATQVPRRVEGGGVQSVPAVQSDKAGTNPDVILNLPNPVLEASTDAMRPRDASQKAAATQLDRPEASVVVRRASEDADIATGVRQGLSREGLPDRLLRLLMQLEQVSAEPDRPVMWPASEQLRAARPDVALANLRQALANSMLFEIRRLQSRWVPSAAVEQSAPGGRRDNPGVQPGAASAGTLSPGWPEFPARIHPKAGGFDPGVADVPDGTPQPPAAVAGSVTERNTKPAVAQPDAPEKALPGNERAGPVVEARKEAQDTAGDDAAQMPTATGPDADDATEETSPPPSVWRRSGETLTAESPSIRDAVRLLLHGELRWQGELSPGVFATLDREDFWEEDAHSPGALVKGVSVKIDLDLPQLGRVQVRGMFVKDAVRINVLPQESAQASLTTHFQSLKDRLQARGLECAQVRLLEGENG